MNRNLNYLQLVEIAQELQNDYPQNDEWAKSPFGQILALSPRTKGAFGERLVEKYFSRHGFDVCGSPDTDADRLINGIRVEIKTSTVWKNGMFAFQQIRNQNYEIVICLGIFPNDVKCWVLDKKTAIERSKPQHSGAKRKDTKWIKFPANNPPEWIVPFGGTPQQAVSVLRTMTTGMP